MFYQRLRLLYRSFRQNSMDRFNAQRSVRLEFFTKMFNVTRCSQLIFDSYGYDDHDRVWNMIISFSPFTSFQQQRPAVYFFSRFVPMRSSSAKSKIGKIVQFINRDVRIDGLNGLCWRIEWCNSSSSSSSSTVGICKRIADASNASSRFRTRTISPTTKRTTTNVPRIGLCALAIESIVSKNFYINSLHANDVR